MDDAGFGSGIRKL